MCLNGIFDHSGTTRWQCCSCWVGTETAVRASGHQRATQRGPAPPRRWLPSNCDATGSQFAPSSRPPRLFLALTDCCTSSGLRNPKATSFLSQENLKWSRDPKFSSTLASREWGYRPCSSECQRPRKREKRFPFASVGTQLLGTL